MAEASASTSSNSLCHRDSDLVATLPIQAVQEAIEGQNPRTEGVFTRSTLDNMWQEIGKDSQLTDALRPLWIPEALKSLFDAISLEQKEMTGKFPTSRDTVIMILWRAGGVLSELAVPENDTHLDQAITCLHQLVLLSNEDDVQIPERLVKLGLLLLLRAENRNVIQDINRGIEHLTRALQLNQTVDILKMVIFTMLGLAYLARSRLRQEIQDIDTAIGYQKKAILLIGDTNEDSGRLISLLGCSYSMRFEHSGTFRDMDESIEQMTRGLRATPHGHAYRKEILPLLGDALRHRFDRLGELADIDRAIAYQSEAVLLTPGGHPGKLGRLSELGNSHRCRFDHLGDVADIEQAIARQSEAMLLASEDHPYIPTLLDYLGSSYVRRHELLGEIVDIDQAVACHSKAVLLTPNGHVERPGRLCNLGASLMLRFGFNSIVNVPDIDRAITCISDAVQLIVDRDSAKPSALNNLGVSYQRRFERFGSLADLEQAIECASKAVSLTPSKHPDKPRWLTNLGSSYHSRFILLGELVDIDQAIKFQLEAVSLIPYGHRENSIIAKRLGSAYQSRFERFGNLPDLDQAIEFILKAVALTPNGRPYKPTWLNFLGSLHHSRFLRLGELLDIDQAVACLLEMMFLTPDGHPERSRALNALGILYGYRFKYLGERTDVDRAIAYLSQAEYLTPNGHIVKPEILGNLGGSYLHRFGNFGDPADLDQAIACHSKHLSLTPHGGKGRFLPLMNLGSSYQRRFEKLGEPADIDKAIAYMSEGMNLAPGGHAYKGTMLNDLGLSYRYRFQCLGEPKDIEQAIAYQSEATFVTPDGHVDKPGWLRNLGDSYLYRFAHLGETADLDRSMSFFQTAAQLPTGRILARFRAAISWARLASRKDQSSLISYSRAMQLVPKIIWIGSTVDSRYDNIHLIGTVAAEAAAAAISAKECALALEWLESGRSIVWNQTLQLRTQFDDLHAVAPNLTKILQQVTQELEATSGQEIAVTEIDSQNSEAVAQRRRRLAEEYEKRITEVRQLKGFEDFMQSKKIADLIPVVQSGPVIVINVHITRCDALALLPHSSNLAHIPLPNLLLSDVAKLQGDMQEALASKGLRERRMHRPGPKLQDPLESILAALWHKLVSPVLDFLGYTEKLPVEQLPHITWCTTGALSFLPIHAAGCYDDSGQNIFNFAVSSYTPTLSALLGSKNRSHEIGSILAVSQEATPGCSPLPDTKTELIRIRQHTHSIPNMQLENDQATVEAVLNAMEQYNSVHLACHGSQTPKNPTQSSFHLHNGTLSLATLAKKSFKNKGLAFLSACQTAAGDETMPDEAVHLAAGMLVAGYPTVIATMWSISDGDAPMVADRVYEQLMKDGKLGDGRAARALHVAVKALREQIGESAFTRWVPYVHIGI